MPWTPQRGPDKHKKGLDEKGKRQWSHVANNMLERGEDEASAVKAANSKTKRKGNLPNKGAIQRRMARRNTKRGGR